MIQNQRNRNITFMYFHKSDFICFLRDKWNRILLFTQKVSRGARQRIVVQRKEPRRQSNCRRREIFPQRPTELLPIEVRPNRPCHPGPNHQRAGAAKGEPHLIHLCTSHIRRSSHIRKGMQTQVEIHLSRRQILLASNEELLLWMVGYRIINKYLHCILVHISATELNCLWSCQQLIISGKLIN